MVVLNVQIFIEKSFWLERAALFNKFHIIEDLYTKYLFGEGVMISVGFRLDIVYRENIDIGVLSFKALKISRLV